MLLPVEPLIYLVPLALLTLIGSLFQIRKNQSDLARKKREIEQKIYETLIMQQISERISYELNTSKILDTILNSLGKLISFSAVGYMLIDESREKVNFTIHLEDSVPRSFLLTMRQHMLSMLKDVTKSSFGEESLTETVSGTIFDETSPEKVQSLWLTPLVIDNNSIGVMAVASRRPGLYHGPEMEILIKILAQANRAVRNLEKVILSEQAKLNAMVLSMADGVLMLDKNLNLLVINPAAEDLLGLPKSGKMTIFDVAKILASKLDLRAKIDEAVRFNKIVVFDNLLAGEKVSQLLISPVKDANNELLGTVIIFHDTTAQRQLEQIREEFTAMMVHELRAPLTVVRGTSDMLLRNPTLSQEPDGRELLSSMERSVATMLTLVNDLLDVAKIEAGKFEVITTPGDLSKVVSDRVAFFSPLAQSKSLLISSEVLGTDLEANFDRDRISQVLNNLLSNALKFTSPNGKITVSVYRIESEANIKWRFTPLTQVKINRPSILVSVSDTGIGIAEDKISELFSKFKQFHPVTTPDSGTGLGLVITKGIIESHGGQIFVESRPSEGSVFYFTLPATEPIVSGTAPMVA